MKRWLQARPRKVKRLMMAFADVVAITFATWAAFSLRVGEAWPEILATRWWLLVMMPLLSVPVFGAIGMYQPIIRYIGPSFLKTVLWGAGISALTMPLLVILIPSDVGFQRTAPAIFFLLAIVLIGGMRSIARWWFVDQRRSSGQVVVYGAGDAGANLVAVMAHAGSRVVAFVDDAESLHGTTVCGVRVHSPKKLPDIVKHSGATDVLLAIPSLSPERRRVVIESLIELPIHVRTVPDLDELVSGTLGMGDLRHIRVEDLLCRDSVASGASQAIEALSNQCVMVTGAGGSVGSELSADLVRGGCSELVLLDRSEPALFRVASDLRDTYPHIRIRPVLADIRDAKVVAPVLRKHAVSAVYHAAAHKHVPLVEENEIEAVNNNVFGTQNLIEECERAGVDRFVLISTDKAVRPTSVMGATKRVSEMIAQQQSGTGMKICMVRFGNVLGSSGSVATIFEKQIQEGGPITVTDPEMIRYFMTIPEAANLVLQAGSMATGGEMYLLDMGQPVKILDLAQLMIRLAGMTERNEQNPTGDIEIVFTGQRDGEKAIEELLVAEGARETSHPMIYQAFEPSPDGAWLAQRIQALELATAVADVAEVRRILFSTVESSDRVQPWEVQA